MSARKSRELPVDFQPAIDRLRQIVAHSQDTLLLLCDGPPAETQGASRASPTGAIPRLTAPQTAWLVSRPGLKAGTFRRVQKLRRNATAAIMFTDVCSHVESSPH
jgi:hypothetical protein